VNAAVPNITAHPATTQYYILNAQASALSVTAASTDGGTLSYQWHNPASDSNTASAPISNATAATYTPPVTALGVKFYYCVVTNMNNGLTGTKTATKASDVATAIVTTAAFPNQTKVSTLAGNGTTSIFYEPHGVAVDSTGNVYVADTYNYSIRKITPAGVITTLAGGFNAPEGVAVDSTGNVYVADTGNQCIKKITPAGVVTTLAGSGAMGYADLTGTAAQFNYPEGVAVDSTGNVYVADYFNNCIRKITPAGVVSTFAGSSTKGYKDGIGTDAQFYAPLAVAVDSADYVYVADFANNAIRKITPAGVVTTLAGGGTEGFANGTGMAAQFYWPKGVAVDSAGYVYVADTYNNRIRKISPAGVVTTLAGNGTGGFANGTGTAAQFNWPKGVAVDSTGNVYVADTYNHAVRKLVP
jgi:streptogramin lyase